MFNFVSKTISTLFQPLRNTFNVLWQNPALDQESLQELEKTLIEADFGRVTTRLVVDNLKKRIGHASWSGNDLQHVLKQELLTLLSTVSYNANRDIFLMIGVNGAGKTTASAKLAYHFMQQGKKVLLVAADTFRAAAVEQLTSWAQHYDISLVTGVQGQDPASVLFRALQIYRTQTYDILIVDTAGRLHTNANLMAELAKMKRVIDHHVPGKKVATLLTIDALLGQNSLEQGRLFHENMSIDGLILTKLDSSSKGGIVYALVNQLNIPIAYLSFGEKIHDIAPFDSVFFVNNTLHIQKN